MPVTGQVFGFLHIATIGSWRQVVDEILESLRRSGLLERTTKLLVGVVGPEARFLDFDEPRIDIIFRSVDPQEYEFPTLTSLRNFTKNLGSTDSQPAESGSPASVVYYLHTKGVSRDSLPTADWRAYMLHFLVDRYADCIAALVDHDICGVNWLSSPWPHFSGNFWWARSDYICELPAVELSSVTPILPDHGRRHRCEQWIGSADGVRVKCLHQSGVDHYRKRYPRSSYVLAGALRRIAIIFDDRIRPDTTGVYCRSALSMIIGPNGKWTHYRPDDLSTISQSAFDLYLYIDDGLDYPLRPDLRPSAYWAIDTHLNPDRSIRRAAAVDFSVTAQRNGVELLRRAGTNCLGWLPLACDPSVHRAHDVAKNIDVCFVGHLNTAPRLHLAAMVRERYTNHFVGQRFFDRMAETYSTACIALNLSVADDINMRVFEAMACGSLLITNDVNSNGLDRLFEPDRHLVLYRSFEGLQGLIDHFLAHPEQRQRIADAGRAHVVANHTYAHRMRTLLQTIESEMGRRADAEAGAFTSIVILTHNGLEQTRDCLASLAASTPEPHEIIMVDNGSTDGTVDFLRGQTANFTMTQREAGPVTSNFSKSTVPFNATEFNRAQSAHLTGGAQTPCSCVGFRLIENEQNLGFPAGSNLGILASRGHRVLLLNNDVILTRGWLGRLLAAMESSSDIGLAGPCSNRVSGAQQVEVKYSDADGLSNFAANHARRLRGQIEPTSRLVGFCLLIRRELINRIGLLDERFGIGNYEDDDFCRRALLAGYRAVIARDSFIHHHGSSTFRSAGIDHHALLTQNRHLFEAKWSVVQLPQLDSGTLGAPQVVAGSLIAKSSSSQTPTTTVSRLEPPRGSQAKKLSLCMIVRDSAKTLPACLQSVRSWVDEIIVVDTGSVDDTPAIAASFGATVSHFPWCDSFASARNASFDRATGDWLFWMDADDTIDETNGRRLRGLVDQSHPDNILGYVMQVHCPATSTGTADPYATATVVDHVKLVRNHPGLRFSGRIHEQLLPAIRQRCGEVAWTDLFLVHSGSDGSPAGRNRKHQRDLRLLELELTDHPDSTFAHFNLGMTLLDANRPAEALNALCRSLQLVEPGESHLRKLHAFLAQCYATLGRPATALRACQKGLFSITNDPELLFRQGVLQQQLGRLADAETSFRTLLSCRQDRYFSSIDQGISGVKAWHNLAIICERQGKIADAIFAWQKVLDLDCENGWAKRALTDLAQSAGSVPKR